MDEKTLLLDIIKKYPKGYSSTLRHKYPELLSKILALPYKTLGEKMYVFIYGNVDHFCKLENCFELTQFKQFSHGYYEFCSCSCRAKYNKSNLNGLTDSALMKKGNTLKLHLKDSVFKQNRQIKMENTHLKNHGVSHWSKTEQFRNNHSAFYANKRPPELNNYEWLYDNYITNNKTIVKIASELNTTWEVVSRALIRHNIEDRHYDYSSSLAEDQLLQFIMSHGIQVQKNNRTILSPKEIDIFIPSHNIAIEYCGLYWHSESANKRNNKSYHNDKRLSCKNKDIILITIFEDEWSKKQEIVKSRIKHALKLNSHNKIYARTCKIKVIGTKEAKFFFDSNHIQGHKNAYLYIGLFDSSDSLISVMSFGKSRYDKKMQWEMIRFSSILNTNVVGAGSKLFSYFVKNYQPESIVSYSDNRWGSGNFYKSLGFEFIKET